MFLGKTPDGKNYQGRVVPVQSWLRLRVARSGVRRRRLVVRVRHGARPDGFELTFTEPVGGAAAGDAASYTMEDYIYIYQSAYGSPEVDKGTPKVVSAKVTTDGRSVRLKVEGLVEGHVHELHATGVKLAKGAPLLHDAGYYTLNQIPR